MFSEYSPLGDKLSDDVENLLVWVANHKPTHRIKLLAEAIAIANFANTKDSDVSKCLSAVQTILSGAGVILADRECINGLAEAIKACQSRANLQVKVKALSVAMLFARRLGRGLSYVSDDTKQSVFEIANTNSDSRIVKSANNLSDLIARAKRDAINRAVSKKVDFEIDGLDVSLAQNNVIADAPQDWFADPWHWPELRRLDATSIFDRLRHSKADWTFALDIPKHSEGIRPALVLSPVDRIAYQAIADELSVVATSGLHEWVFGWRIKRSNARKGEYEDNKVEWKRFLERVTSLTQEFSFVTRVDVRSFFETVKTNQLLRQLGRRYRQSAVLDRLDEYFQQWKQLRNGNGLPQRSLASSILAHIPLQN